MTSIHPTAIVAPGAQLDVGVEVGPYAVIGPHVRIGAGTTVGPHAVIEGHTEIGRQNRVFQFASVGAAPQDLKYRAEPTRLVVGDRNQIREFSTLHRGTVQGAEVTRIGNDCLFMAGSHVAHDCVVGDGVILANGAALAGHVTVDDGAIFGGLSGAHQFCRIGTLAFISGGAMVTMDVAPYCTAQGDRAQLAGLNTVGLQRHGYTPEQIARIKQAYRIAFRESRTLKDAIEALDSFGAGHPEVERFVTFIRESPRGLVR